MYTHIYTVDYSVMCFLLCVCVCVREQSQRVPSRPLTAPRVTAWTAWALCPSPVIRPSSGTLSAASRPSSVPRPSPRLRHTPSTRSTMTPTASLQRWDLTHTHLSVFTNTHYTCHSCSLTQRVKTSVLYIETCLAQSVQPPSVCKCASDVTESKKKRPPRLWVQQETSNQNGRSEHQELTQQLFLPLKPVHTCVGFRRVHLLNLQHEFRVGNIPANQGQTRRRPWVFPGFVEMFRFRHPGECSRQYSRDLILHTRWLSGQKLVWTLHDEPHTLDLSHGPESSFIFCTQTSINHKSQWVGVV